MKNNIKSFFNDSKFYKTLIILALPIILQNILTSSLNMADTLMVGAIGDAQIAAVGIGNQFSFLFNLVVIGTTGGCSIFISQFWGKKDKENIKKVVGISGITVIIIGVLSMMIALFIPEVIVKIFTNDAVVIKEASAYLAIVSLSYVATGITFTIVAALRSMENAKTPMIISAVAVSLNIVLNYIFIFGKFGLPIMGVKGAALATVIARIFETAILIVIAEKNDVLKGKYKEYLMFTRNFVNTVYKSVIPVVLNEACWGLGTFFYSIAYGHLGTEAMAAIQISNNLQNMFFVVCFSIGSAALVMIGNQIGADNDEVAKRYGKKFTILAFILGTMLCVLVIAIAEPSLTLFKVSDTVRNYSINIIKIFALTYPVKVVNLVLIVGVFRGGGDAEFALKAEAASMWLIGVPLAFIASLILGLNLYQVVLLVSIEEIVKFILCINRFRSYKWLNNVIKK